MMEQSGCGVGEVKHVVETNPDVAIAYLVGHGVGALQKGELTITGTLVHNDPVRDMMIVGEHGLWKWFNESFTLVHTPEICRMVETRPSFGAKLNWRDDEERRQGREA